MAIGTTTALLASAAIGAGSQILGASQANRANNNAIQAQQAGIDSTNATNLAIYNQNRNDQAPWRQVGEGALGQLAQIYGLPYTPSAQVNAQQQNLTSQSAADAYLAQNPDVMAEYQRLSPNNLRNNLGVNTPQEFAQWHYQNHGQQEGRSFGTATPAPAQTTQTPSATPQTAPDYSAFYKSPDYQFRLDEGMKALNARNAALGLQDSGAAQKSALSYAGNLASGEFNNYANRLAALAGVGQTATQASASAGNNYANQMAQTNQQQAANLSSSYANKAAINGQLIGGLGGIAGGLIGNAGMFGAGSSGVPNWNQLAIQGGWS